MNIAQIVQSRNQSSAEERWNCIPEARTLPEADENRVQNNRWQLPDDALGAADEVISSESSQEFTGCRLVVVYDGQEARHRAGRLIEKLHLIFGGEIDFKESWWSFSVLKSEPIADLASQDAVEADVILFVFDTGYELPGEISKFNQQWPALRRGRPGLLGVLSRRSDHKIYEVSTLESYFGELAQKAGVDFLSNLIAQPLEAGEGRWDASHNADKVIRPLVDEYFSPSEED